MLPSPATAYQQDYLDFDLAIDDQVFLHSINEEEWCGILSGFDWQAYRTFAADYYNALYEFNQRTPLKISPEAEDGNEVATETKEEAKQRLLFDRVTCPIPVDPSPPVLYQGSVVKPIPQKTLPDQVAPGVVPLRLAGRKPKCFFALFKAYVGASLMGYEAEPDAVYRLLKNNPTFAVICGFQPKQKSFANYHYQQIPELRKVEQFDQIMTEAGIWDQIKLQVVVDNLASGVIELEKELVGDTTHYHAHSSFETVIFQDEKGKDKKKSQSKATKPCRCDDWDHCPHDWELRDDGAGTVVKSHNKMHWAHKASIIGLPKQGVPLDAIAVSDAATHDGQTFFPHVKKVLEDHPILEASIARVLYDSACDDAELKLQFKDELGLELKASFNPRRSRPITQDLPRGIEKITPYGVPICMAGHEMTYQGIRYANECFIYGPPQKDEGISLCLECQDHEDCCNRGNQNGRTITVPFDTLKHIDHDDPPMAKRFKAIMTRRPSVERMIKRLKCDLGSDRLSKRGNDSFQATLDKTMISFYLLLRYLH